MFTLHVDAQSWRDHADQVRDTVEGIVPVAKGKPRSAMTFWS